MYEVDELWSVFLMTEACFGLQILFRMLESLLECLELIERYFGKENPMGYWCREARTAAVVSFTAAASRGSDRLWTTATTVAARRENSVSYVSSL